jgi:hypothetical protein
MSKNPVSDYLSDARAAELSRISTVALVVGFRCDQGCDQGDGRVSNT